MSDLFGDAPPKGRALGSHHSARAQTAVWITPRPIIDALGGPDSFDLDPCAAANQPWPCALADYRLPEQNGLRLPWRGRVYLNPPYSSHVIGAWLGRMAEHGNGAALIFARTETEAFRRWVWGAASGILFLYGRLTFCRPDGRFARGNGGAPSVIVAYGAEELDRLAAAPLEGQFCPLRFPRSVVVDVLPASWRDLVLAYVRERRGPVCLSDLYRHLARHPKVRRNQHWRAKIRQTLQQGPFEPVGRGVWRERA